MSRDPVYLIVGVLLILILLVVLLRLVPGV